MSGPNVNSAALNKTIQEYEETFNAFSGADIIAYMGNKRVATLEGITVSVTREVMPVFVFGDPNPKAFVKGKRAIAGNLVFTQFDKHAILKMASLQGPNVNYVGNLASFSANIAGTVPAGLMGNIANGTTRLATNDSTLTAAVNQELAETMQIVSTRRVRYSDQVPPFDVTITMVDEQGNAAFTSVHGLQLVNEGWGYTLDDLTSQAAFTFVARAITPLDSLTKSMETGTITSYEQNQFYH
jgi:hypothetical protein